MIKDLKVVGKAVKRKDALSKVLGTAKFVADLKRPDMLIGKALYAKYPHALIKNIDISKAVNLDGVEAVMTAKDLPGRNSYGLTVPDKPVIADVKTRYEGDPIALVAAINEEIAIQALKLIEVDYEELPVYDNPHEAMKDDAIPIYDGNPLQEKGNRLETVVVNRGEIDSAFEEADIIIEGKYETPIVDHAYLEPDACIAEPDPITGGITIISSTQIVYSLKRVLAPVFGLPQNKVRVVSPILGGGFGGKECASLDVSVIAGVLALKTKKVVYVELTRDEIFRTTSKRHASYIHHRLAATKDGLIKGVDIEIVLDKGAYVSLGGGRAPRNLTTMRAATRSGGAYFIPNARVNAYGVFTNHAYAGAMRGFGVPQANYAMECQMDNLARSLNMDPLELRMKNILQEGDITIHGQKVSKDWGLGLEECIEKVKKAINWDKPINRGNGVIRRGRGVSLLMYGTSTTNLSDGASCYATLEHDGTLIISVSVSEMGTGLISALEQIAAETMGISHDDVIVQFSDTANSPDAGITAASRSTTVVGNAIIDACTQLRERLIMFAAELYHEDASDITIEDGKVFVINNFDKVQQLETLVAKAYNAQLPLSAHGCWFPPQASFRAEDGQGNTHFTYTFGAHAVELEVDIETGEITILRSVMACDAGKAINPNAVEGQMEGAFGMTVGWALMEEAIIDKGKMKNTAFYNYLIPTIMDIPEQDSIIVEHASGLGPFGAKGMGEPPILGGAPAIRNALYDALGIRIDTIPLTPRVVLDVIKQNNIEP